MILINGEKIWHAMVAGQVTSVTQLIIPATVLYLFSAIAYRFVRAGEWIPKEQFDQTFQGNDYQIIKIITGVLTTLTAILGAFMAACLVRHFFILCAIHKALWPIIVLTLPLPHIFLLQRLAIPIYLLAADINQLFVSVLVDYLAVAHRHIYLWCIVILYIIYFTQ
ncbi:hypothetical protein [Desulfosarcina ovata]|uniref:Uncharacterized protein n=1 Tax=Desulfosarcina ovata subsp. ovata TaxID=2752305 RepID=A0A5K8A6J5_9BACT|nr:hypothetical protein [Desulfosarcina ovata]BBO88253.1 hypothetical protein DSCOOX_14330 [Desulfosarcina ovata subsp. ovata]